MPPAHPDYAISVQPEVHQRAVRELTETVIPSVLQRWFDLHPVRSLATLLAEYCRRNLPIPASLLDLLVGSTHLGQFQHDGSILVEMLIYQDPKER